MLDYNLKLGNKLCSQLLDQVINEITVLILMNETKTRKFFDKKHIKLEYNF